MVSTLSSIVWESESCCIISYPKELQAELVSSPYGVHKDQQTAVGEGTLLLALFIVITWYILYFPLYIYNVSLK